MRSKNIWYICAFSFLLFGKGIRVFGQPHNGEVYRQLISEYLSEQENMPKAILGQKIESWMPPYQVDSTSNVQFILSPAQIEYERISRKAYSRKISLRLTIQDTSIGSLNKVFQDTLAKSIFKRKFQASPEELRGDNPILMAKVGLPLILITGSVAGVIALFFVRSR